MSNYGFLAHQDSRKVPRTTTSSHLQRNRWQLKTQMQSRPTLSRRTKTWEGRTEFTYTLTPSSTSIMEHTINVTKHIEITVYGHNQVMWVTSAGRPVVKVKHSLFASVTKNPGCSFFNTGSKYRKMHYHNKRKTELECCWQPLFYLVLFLVFSFH